MFFCIDEKRTQSVKLDCKRFSPFYSERAHVRIRPITMLPAMGALVKTKEMGLFVVQKYSAGYRLSSKDNAEQFLYCSDKFDTVYLPANYSKVDPAYELLLNVFRSNLITRGDLCAHGAVVVCNDEAVMFCGLSTAGKSTQAGLWRDKLGAWVLNYDKPALIRRQKYLISGTPWSGKEPCYMNRQVPLKAVFFVEKYHTNEVRRLTMAEAFAHMFPNYMPMPVNETITEAYEMIIADWATKIPVFVLRCRIEEEAVRIAYKAVFDTDYEKVKKTLGGGISVQRNNKFVMRCIADDYVIIARGAEAVNFNATLITNELGAFIWRCLEKEMSIGELVTMVLEEYSVDEITAREDITDFLIRLEKEGLLQK